MVLNYIWIAFFLIAFVAGLVKLFVLGDYQIFPSMMLSAFDAAKTGFELSLGLTGLMTLWMGIMKIGEKGGVVNILARAVGPFFSRLMPEVPKKHPVHGSIMMNLTSNMLGLDNAATPLGLKAMNELQELNPKKDTASNAQIMFMVLNATGLMLIPMTIMMYRTQLHAANPADIFIPILLSTSTAAVTGVIAVSIIQKINLFNRVVLLYLGSFVTVVGLATWYFSTLSPDKLSVVSSLAAYFLIFTIIVAFIVMALVKKVQVYDAFIEGAKEGFNIAIRIIPYLVAMLVGIAVFRTSGAMDVILNGLAWSANMAGINTDFIPAMPTAFMKPLSGSGARGLMLDTMTTYGADSFVGRLSCIFQGTTDTTFYVLAVYFGSIGVKYTRHAVACALLADLAGIIAAIVVAYIFFG
jgi:spore maturation protein SpmA